MNRVIKLIIHSAIIATLMLLGAVLSHFGLVVFTRHNARCTVPQFKGLILHEAEYLAQRESLNIIINDSLYAPTFEGGMVLEQLPRAGVEVKPGRAIYVTINAFGQKRVAVPYVAGRSLRQAKNMLEVAGLQIKELIYTPDIATNYVLEQWLSEEQIFEKSNVEAVVNSGITLYVGQSARDTTTLMPPLMGLRLNDAKSRLWDAGLNLGEVLLPEDITPQTRGEAMVYVQSTEDGEDVALGEKISISLTLSADVVEQAIKDLAQRRKEAEEERQRVEDSLARERIEALSWEIQHADSIAPQSHDESNYFE